MLEYIFQIMNSNSNYSDFLLKCALSFAVCYTTYKLFEQNNNKLIAASADPPVKVSEEIVHQHVHENTGDITIVKSGYLGVKAKHSLPNERNCYVEVSLSDYQSAINAYLGGANSIELCADRENGGITPSFGLISSVVERFKYTDVSIHVLIRPRAGDFVYSPDEMDIIMKDVIMCRDLGVDGIVIGFLTQESYIDYEKLQLIMDIVYYKHHNNYKKKKNYMQVTFHRAFDVCKDILEYSNTLDNEVLVGGDKRHVGNTVDMLESDLKPPRAYSTDGSGTWVDCESDIHSNQTNHAMNKDMNIVSTLPITVYQNALMTISKLSHMGVTRLLTSGGKETVLESFQNTSLVNDFPSNTNNTNNTSDNRLQSRMNLLQVLVSDKQYIHPPIVIIAASGIKEMNLMSVLQHTEVSAVHVSSCVHTKTSLTTSNKINKMNTSIDNHTVVTTDTDGTPTTIHSMIPPIIPSFILRDIVSTEKVIEIVNVCMSHWYVSDPKDI